MTSLALRKLMKSRADNPLPESQPPATKLDRRGDLPRLETVSDAEEHNRARVDALVNREPEIAVRLEACEHGSRCGMIICAVCARSFRLPLIRETLRIARSQPGVREWGTIYLETAKEGCLADVSVRHARDRLRQRLQRSGFAGSMLIGGIEVSWLSRDRVWLLHVHVLAIRVPQAAWVSLEEKLAKSGRADPIDVNDLSALERQISYTFKYVTYHRPGKSGPDRRARAYPLPPDRLAEIARWWAQYSFDDLVFLYGARRRGGHIVPIA